MADIVVRVPKGQIDHFWEETAPDAIEWWTLSSKPGKCGVGDYIYFVIDGFAVARAKIDYLTNETLDCDATGRQWKGIHIVWKSPSFEKLDWQFPCKAGRGFRYLIEGENEHE